MFELLNKTDKSCGLFKINTGRVFTNILLQICVVSLEIMNPDTFATAALLNWGCES